MSKEERLYELLETHGITEVGGMLLALQDEVARSACRAEGAAEVIAGIPIYMSLWSTLSDIARDLRRALTATETECQYAGPHDENCAG